MKWIILALVLLPVSVAATIINYEFSGSAETVYEPDRYPLTIFASVNTKTGEITNASATFLSKEWLQSGPEQYVYELILSPDHGTLMHWLQWSLELTSGTDTLWFNQYLEWKVPSLGDNPLNRLETSVAIIGGMYLNGEHFGAGMSVTKVPEPNSLLLMLLGVGVLLASRSLRSADGLVPRLVYDL